MPNKKWQAKAFEAKALEFKARFELSAPDTLFLSQDAN